MTSALGPAGPRRLTGIVRLDSSGPKERDTQHPDIDTSRCKLMQQAAAVGALSAIAGPPGRRPTIWPHTAPPRSTGSRSKAKSISAAVIPASYFENLITLLPQLEALAGIKVRVEKVPPGQIAHGPRSTMSRRAGQKPCNRQGGPKLQRTLERRLRKRHGIA